MPVSSEAYWADILPGTFALFIIKNLKAASLGQRIDADSRCTFNFFFHRRSGNDLCFGIPIAAFTNWLTNVLLGLGTSSKLVLGLVIGSLCIVDFGGPINKTVYAFTLTLLASGIREPVTALQLVNTATPIGFGLAYLIAKAFTKISMSRSRWKT